MKLARCPICHSDWHLEALCEDDASRELLTLLANLPGGNARHLVAYIGLFRREKNNLSNSRALKLANEVLELYTPGRVLSHALSETVERIRAKRSQGDCKPLSNHAYLSTVYSSSQQQFSQSSSVDQRAKKQLSGSDSNDAYYRQMQAMGVIEKVKGGPEWLKAQGENHE